MTDLENNLMVSTQTIRGLWLLRKWIHKWDLSMLKKEAGVQSWETERRVKEVTGKDKGGHARMRIDGGPEMGSSRVSLAQSSPELSKMRRDSSMRSWLHIEPCTLLPSTRIPIKAPPSPWHQPSSRHWVNQSRGSIDPPRELWRRTNGLSYGGGRLWQKKIVQALSTLSPYPLWNRFSSALHSIKAYKLCHYIISTFKNYLLEHALQLIFVPLLLEAHI